MAKRVLLIDDEESFGRAVKLNLEASGEYIVNYLNDGTQAQKAAQEFQPDFIFLDVVMPNIDGSDVFNQLSEKESTKNIPVVFLTAVATSKEVDASGGYIGGHPFLAKPVTTQQLIECIKKYTG